MVARSSSSRRCSVSAGRRSTSPLMRPPLPTFRGELVGRAAAASREDAPRRGGGPCGVPPAGRRRRRPSDGPQPRTRAHPRDGGRRTWRPPAALAAGTRSEATRRHSVHCCLSSASCTLDRLRARARIGRAALVRRRALTTLAFQGRSRRPCADRSAPGRRPSPGRRGIARWAPVSAQRAPPGSIRRLARQRDWHSIGRPRRRAIPDTEEMPTAGLDPLTQAILCLSGLVPPGADPVVVLLADAATSYS